jgi:putative ATP-binding cassette transporter
MSGFWGLMRAYWFSESWKEAWALTMVIAALTALASKASVWMAEASGELINSIAFFHSEDNLTPLRSLLVAAGTLVLIVILKDAGFTGIRHLFSTTLHRKWRAWLDRRFNDALLDANHTHYHLQNGDAGAALDNVDQRVQEAIKGMTGGAIGLAMGIVGVIMSVFFVGQKLLETSTSVTGLEFLGEYGSAALAFAAVLVYVPVNTWIALKLGGLLERLTIRMSQAEGSYRGALNTLLRRSFHVAAAGGEGVQNDIHKRIYKDIDGTWGSLNRVHAGYMSFELIYNFIAARIVAYGPGLLPYMNQKVSLKNYVTGAELINSMIQQCSWFIQVMPAIATLKANSRRLTELVEAIENVQAPVDYYRRTGRSEFVRTTQDSEFGLTIANLELMHQGVDAKAFLSAPFLNFRRGEWTFVSGESGCGKTSLIKAINGLWPYGAGSIALPAGVRTFYASQDIRLPPITLKRLVCLPDAPDAFHDLQVAAALHDAGLGHLIAHIEEESRDGQPWDTVLSGGQRQKLFVARILLHKPGLLFLDEATAALDGPAKIAFHQAIKDHCPEVTVISVMHEAVPPRALSGESFYDSILTVAGGVASKRPFGSLLTEVTIPFPEKRRRRRRLDAISIPAE